MTEPSARSSGAGTVTCGQPALAEDRASATVARMVLGATLQRLREKAGLSTADASVAIALPAPRIADVECGQIGLRLRHVAGLCAAYGVSDVTLRATLLGLARQANSPQWWHSYADLVPEWFECYLGLEQAASLIRGYTAQVIPVLLQTSDYAREIITLAHRNLAERDVQRRVELRLRRQQVLRGPCPPRLWVMIDEAALRRHAGSRTSMRGQLRHLIAAAELPNVTIRVLPFRLGGHLATGGPLAVLRLPDPQLPDIAYLEQLASGVYFRRPAQVDFYRHILNLLAVQAEAAGPPQVMLDQILKEI
ncbi:MAG TPA: helix-turn-helix transcriptional regulator [Streptosporangiaceae bacterium]|nr:helix-turn-helix transcriptional regulator [Streptosporangiaceae bacterium]